MQQPSRSALEVGNSAAQPEILRADLEKNAQAAPIEAYTEGIEPAKTRNVQKSFTEQVFSTQKTIDRPLFDGRIEVDASEVRLEGVSQPTPQALGLAANSRFSKLASTKPKVAKYHERLEFKASNRSLQAAQIQMHALKYGARPRVQ